MTNQTKRTTAEVCSPAGARAVADNAQAAVLRTLCHKIIQYVDNASTMPYI